MADDRYFRSDLGIADSSTQSLPDRLDQPENLAWRVSIDSGQSTPVVANGKVFVTTFNAESELLATLALDERSGALLWKQPLQVEQIEKYHPSKGNAAAATPACDGERLYVFFGSYGLICYDLDGIKLWEQKMGPFQDEFGAGSSPVLVNDMIILNQDHDADSFVIAFDKTTGKTRWKTPRPDAVRSYSTPTIWSWNGKRQLLVAGALTLTSYDPDTGKQLWFTSGLARIVIPNPIPAGDRIYMASWAPGGDSGRRISFDPWPVALENWDEDKNGQLAKSEIKNGEVLNRFVRMDLDQSENLDQAEWERQAAVFDRAENSVIALKPSEAGGKLADTDVIWRYDRGIPYVATPLLHRGILWMVKDGGIVTKLEASDGTLLHRERLAGHGSYYASPVAGDGKVYFADDRGFVSVVTSSRDWKILSSHKFREKIQTTPVIQGNRIYIRTQKALYAFQ